MSEIKKYLENYINDVDFFSLIDDAEGIQTLIIREELEKNKSDLSDDEKIALYNADKLLFNKKEKMYNDAENYPEGATGVGKRVYNNILEIINKSVADFEAENKKKTA